MNCLGSKVKLVVVVVVGLVVIIKVILMLVDFDENDMEVQIELEVVNYILYLIEEVNLDFEVIGLILNNLEMVQVLLVVLCLENVELCQFVLEFGGLQVKVMDVEVFVVENVYVLVVSELLVFIDGVVVLVDIGVIMIIFNVLCGGCSFYSCEQVFGGKQLIDEIMCCYGLSYEEVGLVKCQGGLLESYEMEVLELFKEVMVQQISCLLQFFYVGSEFNCVDYIVLVGGCVVFGGLLEMVEEQLGVLIVVVNLLVQMILGLKVNVYVLVQDVFVLMIVIGLVLRSFD